MAGMALLLFKHQNAKGIVLSDGFTSLELERHHERGDSLTTQSDADPHQLEITPMFKKILLSAAP